MDLFDILGNKIFASQANEKETVLDLSSKEKRVYFLRVKNDKYIFIQRLVLQ